MLRRSTDGLTIARASIACRDRTLQLERPEAWPHVAIAVPLDAPSGAYIATFDDEDAGDLPDAFSDGRNGRALLVVRGWTPASLLVNLPLFTYHAYNIAHVDGTLGESEGECLYSGPRTVSLHRPGGGIGGHTWDAVNHDVYDRSSPRQTFAHWDWRALTWLHARGIAADVSTDLDLHEGVYPKPHHRAVLAFGHQEYWTQALRERLEAHVEAGGALALFSGNTGWFRIAYDPANRSITRAGRWDDVKPAISGLSYARGGGKWRGPRPATGFRIRDSGHWLVAGCFAAPQASFGASERIAGYECDGAEAGDDAVVAEASLLGWDVSDGTGELTANANAAIVVREGRGVIVHAGTTDWPRLLGKDATVDRITLNVLTRKAATLSHAL